MIQHKNPDLLTVRAFDLATGTLSISALQLFSITSDYFHERYECQCLFHDTFYVNEHFRPQSSSNLRMIDAVSHVIKDKGSGVENV